MRPSAALRSTEWLEQLRKVDLERIARATGLQTSGTKRILVPRIAEGLASRPTSSSISFLKYLKSRYVGPATKDRSKLHPINRQRLGGFNTDADAKAHAKYKPLSILSIDMGIQNLAFAHLRLPRTTSDPDSPPNLPVLTAWYRLAVSDLAILNADDGKRARWRPKQNQNQEPEPQPESEPADSDAFAPGRYSVIAYNLVNALVNTYHPTHVLIERQRFRTGGSSEIPEWTLRVGVFEGMIYAALDALCMERGIPVIAEDIDPKRVLRYWLELSGKSGKDSKILPTARETKKVKIDMIGKWIAAARNGPSKSPSESGRPTGELVLGPSESQKVLLASRSESPALQGIVDAYIRTFQGSRTCEDASRSRKGALSKMGAGADADIGKLDDLADCLLQGLAWVEWQAMKERIVREGPEILGIKRKKIYSE